MRPDHTREEAAGGVFSESFEQFWREYPHYEGRSVKIDAWSGWCDFGIEADENLQERVLEWVRFLKQTTEWTKDKGRYVKCAGKWLATKKWLETDVPEIPYREGIPDCF